MRVERGDVIAKRYVISEVHRAWLQFPQPVGEMCTGVDAILDTTVAIAVAESKFAGDLVDTARRRALITDPRVPGVLDVGIADDVVFIVFEHAPAVRLSQVLRRGPLHPPVARALAGELGEVLSHAARRGLHHGNIGPDSIAFTAEGELTLYGIASDAALAQAAFGENPLEGADAKRADALAIIDVLYAALSGYWPHPIENGAIPLAPRKNTRVVPLEELREGLPEDLLSLVTGVTSGSDPGPRSAAEVIRYLESTWDRTALGSIAAAHSAAIASGVPRTIPAPTPASAKAPQDAAPRRRDRKQATHAQLHRTLSHLGLSRRGTHGLAAGLQDGTHSPMDAQMQMADASVFPISADALDTSQTEEWSPDQTIDEYSSLRAQEEDINMTAAIMDRDIGFRDGAPTQLIGIPTPAELAADARGANAASAGTTQELSRVERPTGAAGPNDYEPQGAWFMGGLFQTREELFAEQKSSFLSEKKEWESRTPRPLVRPQASQAPLSSTASRETNQGGTNAAAHAMVGIDPAVTAAPTPSGPASKPRIRAQAPKPSPARTASAASATSPVLSASPPVTPTQGGKWKGILAAVLVVVLLAGAGTWWMSSRADGISEDTAPAEQAPANSDNQEAPEPVPEPAAQPIDMTEANAYDPQGDGAENDALVTEMLTDGGGEWRTDEYASADFGGLKSGLGIGFKLSAPASVQRIRIESPSSGTKGEIRVGDADDPLSAQTLQEFELSAGTTEVSLESAPEAQHVFIWLTRLGPDGQGYRARIQHVSMDTTTS